MHRLIIIINYAVGVAQLDMPEKSVLHKKLFASIVEKLVTLKVCRSKSVKLVTVYGEEHDDSAENSDRTRFFWRSVKSTNENQLDQRSISLRVNDVPLVFRIDTNADVTVISEQAFNNFSNVSLRLTNKTLSGPERQQY